MSRKILITGCSSGFGLDAAKTLAGKGHHVYATMREVEGRNAPKARELREFAEAEGVSISVHEMDVTSDESVAAAVAGLGDVDVVINNAGYGYGGPVESFSADEILQQLDLNVVGTARVTNAVLPRMREQGDGLIIQVSSVAGRGAFPGFGVYHASKWGLEGMSEALRYELAPLGIDVVIVEPGPFETSFLDNLRQGSRQEVMPAYGQRRRVFRGLRDVGQPAFRGRRRSDGPRHRGRHLPRPHHSSEGAASTAHRRGPRLRVRCDQRGHRTDPQGMPRGQRNLIVGRPGPLLKPFG